MQHPNGVARFCRNSDPPITPTKAKPRLGKRSPTLACVTPLQRSLAMYASRATPAGCTSWRNPAKSSSRTSCWITNAKYALGDRRSWQAGPSRRRWFGSAYHPSKEQSHSNCSRCSVAPSDQARDSRCGSAATPATTRIHSVAAAHGIGVLPLRPDIPDEAHAYLVTLTVGHLALLVYGHVFPIPAEFTIPAEFASSFIPIWLPTPEVVEWPPSDSLDDTGLEAITKSLGEPIPQSPTNA
jgi:hypothetical protein